MLPATLLIKKRNGIELSDDEIRFLVEGFCDGTVADYQMSAFAMAVCLRGMSPRETATLTRSMLESGDRLPRPPTSGRPRVDKHSTGGLGDKVSLVLAPMLASCGVDVPMVSGRGLGITGGTLDKLEAIPGFRTEYDADTSSKILQSVGAFIIGANEGIAPADKKLYALRDVTGTVESIPLITASILSKKLAASLDALVMDVKVGQAAFMQTFDEAIRLSQSLVQVGGEAGLPTSVIVSDMDQPLGRAVGNAIEVNEAVEVLDGGGPPEVAKLTIELAANVLLEVNAYPSRDEAINALTNSIHSGSAMEKWLSMVHAQGGNWNDPLPLAPAHEIRSNNAGYIESFDCRAIGNAVVAMGGGRRKMGDTIDPSVGLMVHHRIGDQVEKGDPIYTVHFHEGDLDCIEMLDGTFQVHPSPVTKRPLILEWINDGER